VLFDPRSAELTADAQAELDRAAVTLSQTRARPIELRAFAGGGGTDSRKMSLARALAVRAYLIERGVKGKIDVSANLAQGGAATSNRVDIVTRGTQ
jgi:outer membrane protein OmpA-like peptidoglycan-associated protein